MLSFRQLQPLAVLLPILSYTPAALATHEDVSLLTEEDFLTEIPVVLTATRLAQPLLEAPAAITIIDREMISASGAREVAELFRLVPGFMVNYEDGHTPIVMYHGLSDEYVKRLQVLIDGRTVYSPVYGGASWTNLPLSIHDIDRIEVIRGPNSASYGSNSFLAIINIITRNPAETSGTMVHANRGDNGISDTYARLGSSINKLDYRLSFERSSDNGFETRGDDYFMNRVMFRGDYNIDPSTSLMTQLGASYGTRVIDSMTLQTEMNRRINDHFQQIRWSHQLDPTEEISLQFFHNIEHQDQIKTQPVTGIGEIGFDFSFLAERFDLEFQHTTPLSESLRAVWGLGTRIDSAKSDQVFGTSPDTGYTGDKDIFHNQISRVFGNVEWRYNQQLSFNLGTTLEKSDIAGIEFSPRVAVNYLFTPYQSLRFVASKATRSPNINETYANYRIPINGISSQPVSFITTIWRGDEGLEPERITSYELGYHIDKVRSNYELDLKIFSEKLRNLITFDENNQPDASDFLDGSYAIYGNLIDASVKGVEASIDLKPRTDIRLILSYSYTTINNDEPNRSSIELTESTPRHLSSLLLIKRMESGASASVNFVRATKFNGLGSGEEIDGYSSLNARISTPLRLFGSNGHLAVVFRNIGSDYLDWRDDNLTEESMFISVNSQWN